MLKYMTAGLMGSAMLATAAFAQTTPATESTTAPAATAAPSTDPAVAPVTASDSSYNGNWRASKVVGLSVYNANNESLGSINDLLTDQSGNIKAVVVGVGGFLGVGEHLVAVPYDKIKFVNEPVVTNTAATGASGASGMTAIRPSAGTTTGSAPAAPVAKPNPWYPDHAVLNATKDELKAMPEFKYST
jgi:sporulation protein YlmC with PRC-barrel domain